MSNSIEIKNVTKKYKNFTLDNINLTLPTGCIMGLVGENGAGKTTLIKAMLGLIKFDGKINVLGSDNNENFLDTKQDIGVVLDEGCFPDMFTPAEICRIMKNSYKNWDTDCFNNYISRFNLPNTTKFKELSKGMKMKLSIAVALSHNAKLLILDEPTSGLDPIVRDEIVEIFNDFTRDENHSVFISSHIVSDLEKICDYITFMHNGKVVLCEEKDALLDKYALLVCTNEQLKDVPEKAIINVRQNEFGCRALVEKHEINSSFNTEKPTIEDIIIMISKGDLK